MADDNWGVTANHGMALCGEEDLDAYLVEDEWTTEKPKAPTPVPKAKKSQKKVTIREPPTVEPEGQTPEEIKKLVLNSELDLLNDLFESKSHIGQKEMNTTDLKTLTDHLVRFILSVEVNNEKFSESIILELADSCNNDNNVVKPERLAYLSKQLDMIGHNKKIDNRKVTKKKSPKVNLKSERKVTGDIFDSDEYLSEEIPEKAPTTYYEYLEQDFM